MGHVPILTSPSGLPAESGSYVLLLDLPRARRLDVGALGFVAFEPGVHLYVGNARGPGGLRARLGPGDVECAWAERLRGLPETEAPVSGFGPSDCGCPSHLLRCPALPTPLPPPGVPRISALWRPPSRD